jgi:hypothetical protein
VAVPLNAGAVFHVTAPSVHVSVALCAAIVLVVPYVPVVFNLRVAEVIAAPAGIEDKSNRIKNLLLLLVVHGYDSKNVSEA